MFTETATVPFSEAGKIKNNRDKNLELKISLILTTVNNI
jgi:hypothetical protein